MAIASIAAFDAQSTSKLYVRIDRKSLTCVGLISIPATASASWPAAGRVAEISKRDLGNYSRSMTGARGHYDKDGVLLNGFATKDNLVQLVEEFPGQGISGAVAIPRRDAVAGSEKVEIITRDRYQPAVILAVETCSATAL